MSEKYIILEDVYYDDIFEGLTDYIIKEFKDNEVVSLSFNEILDKLPDSWPGKKYLKNKKNLIIVQVRFTNKFEVDEIISKFKFTDDEIAEIKKHMKNAEGFFLSELENYDKNLTFIFLDSLLHINHDEEHEILCHELIHLFQEISGRSKYKVNQKKLFNISEKDKVDIKRILNLEESQIQNIFSKDEIATYLKNAYSYIKEETGFKLFDLRLFLIASFTKLESIKHRESFIEFYKEMKNFNNEYFIENYKKFFNKIFVECSHNKICIALIVLACYFKIGINTIKNHLFGYLNKDKNII
jgi:hypothetical protein